MTWPDELRGRVSWEEVMKGARKHQVSKTTVEIAIRCREELGLSGAEIARHRGVNTTTINRALEKRRKPYGTGAKCMSPPGWDMPLSDEKPLHMTMVINLPDEFVSYLRASLFRGQPEPPPS